VHDPESRTALIAQVFADPPRVHAVWGAEGGVYSTADDCYAYLAQHVEPGSRTLETGCGVSTALFTLWGAEHTCVVPNDHEEEVFRAWAAERDVDLGRVRFEIGLSDRVLPALEPTELDVVFVDGGHGFPASIIDWYYAAGRLRDGGVVVLDDIQLASVRLGLFEFLDADPRWEPVAKTWKWAAVARRGSGPLAEDWDAQPFLNGPGG
jgi:Methyltransferase domain